MLRLFPAGLIAAFMQLAFVVLATLVVTQSVGHGLVIPETPEVAPHSAFPVLAWIYLLTALGVALTSNRFIDVTAARINRASRLIYPREPETLTKALLVHLWLAAVGFGMLALRSPPAFLIEAGRNFGGGDAASIIWSGAMSIGAALFGANAQAVGKAL